MQCNQATSSSTNNFGDSGWSAIARRSFAFLIACNNLAVCTVAGQGRKFLLVARIIADAARQFVRKHVVQPALLPRNQRGQRRLCSTCRPFSARLRRSGAPAAAAARPCPRGCPPSRLGQRRQRRAALLAQPAVGVGHALLLAARPAPAAWSGIGSANLRQRDRMVGSSRSRLFDDSRNTVPGGGSSSVFSKAFEAGMLSASAGYSTTTRKPWRWVEMFMKSASCADLLDLDFLRRRLGRLGFLAGSASRPPRPRPAARLPALRAARGGSRDGCAGRTSRRTTQAPQA